ncbi:hypothetical protein WMY93_013762 [Mugilogobius chulae]|uniref:Uncharacterized protein n=1 Tax=Mugilogobius chulae TaxID=88201 RepID=A0AAW0P0X4_9GOBI
MERSEEQSRQSHSSKYSDCSVTITEYEYSNGHASQEELQRYNSQQQREKHHYSYQIPENALQPNPFAPDLIHNTEEGQSSYPQHSTYLTSLDEEPPVLTYEGGPRTDGSSRKTPRAKTRRPATVTHAALIKRIYR